MDASFIIVASGKGTRMGGTPKQFCQLGSMPMWNWSALVANALFREGFVGECVLVIPDVGKMELDVNFFEIPLRFAPGGMERVDSVLSGLREASGKWFLCTMRRVPLFRSISAGAFFVLLEKAELFLFCLRRTHSNGYRRQEK
jgi:2-C-methyl-D-erythritol 4-phosphate cytidylyltransferase